MFNKEKLMAIREAEALELMKTLLVDVHVTVDKAKLEDLVKVVAESLELNYKFMSDLINPYTPDSKKANAIKAVRLAKVPNTMLIVADTLHDVTNWVQTYTGKDIITYVYHTDDERFYTSDEYFTWFGKEMILDFIMRFRNSSDRAFLEDLAESFGAALGWSFSGPIRDQSITADYFDKFKAYEVLPYAGWKGNYGFAETVRAFNDTLIEDSELSGKTTVTPSLKSRAMVGRACPTTELEQFRDYITALIEANLLADSLEDGWILCECGHPVRQFGPIEAHTCAYCDRDIPEFYCTDVDMPYHLVQVYELGRQYHAEHPNVRTPKAVMRQALRLAR